ncbi:flagellar protein FlaG [Bacillus alveayuensis]|uniref:flagellar protein FlaG n=1 Tax=Aeribacillus alveayuensis TaxID=279215 RepID=UPI0005D11D42|nr:flagellar protein FlaG [Bacillus alveayuensis]
MIDRVSSQPSSTYMYDLKKVTSESQTDSTNPEQVSQPTQAKQEDETIPKEKLKEIVKGMNEFLQPSQTSLKFELHNELKEYYVQIIDERTREVIREIPPKKLLDMYATMMQFVGLIVDKKI